MMIFNQNKICLGIYHKHKVLNLPSTRNILTDLKASLSLEYYPPMHFVHTSPEALSRHPVSGAWKGDNITHPFGVRTTLFYPIPRRGIAKPSALSNRNSVRPTVSGIIGVSNTEFMLKRVNRGKSDVLAKNQNTINNDKMDNHKINKQLSYFLKNYTHNKIKNKTEQYLLLTPYTPSGYSEVSNPFPSQVRVKGVSIPEGSVNPIGFTDNNLVQTTNHTPCGLGGLRQSMSCKPHSVWAKGQKQAANINKKNYFFLQTILSKYIETSAKRGLVFNILSRSNTFYGYNQNPYKSGVTKEYFLLSNINNKSFLCYWLIPVVGLALITSRYSLSTSNVLVSYNFGALSESYTVNPKGVYVPTAPSRDYVSGVTGYNSKNFNGIKVFKDKSPLFSPKGRILAPPPSHVRVKGLGGVLALSTLENKGSVNPIGFTTIKRVNPVLIFNNLEGGFCLFHPNSVPSPLTRTCEGVGASMHSVHKGTTYDSRIPLTQGTQLKPRRGEERAANPIGGYGIAKPNIVKRGISRINRLWDWSQKRQNINFDTKSLYFKQKTAPLCSQTLLNNNLNFINTSSGHIPHFASLLKLKLIKLNLTAKKNNLIFYKDAFAFVNTTNKKVSYYSFLKTSKGLERVSNNTLKGSVKPIGFTEGKKALFDLQTDRLIRLRFLSNVPSPGGASILQPPTGVVCTPCIPEGSVTPMGVTENNGVHTSPEAAPSYLSPRGFVRVTGYNEVPVRAWRESKKKIQLKRLAKAQGNTNTYIENKYISGSNVSKKFIKNFFTSIIRKPHNKLTSHLILSDTAPSKLPETHTLGVYPRVYRENSTDNTRELLEGGNNFVQKLMLEPTIKRDALHYLMGNASLCRSPHQGLVNPFGVYVPSFVSGANNSNNLSYLQNNTVVPYYKIQIRKGRTPLPVVTPKGGYNPHGSVGNSSLRSAQDIVLTPGKGLKGLDKEITTLTNVLTPLEISNINSQLAKSESLISNGANKEKSVQGSTPIGIKLNPIDLNTFFLQLKVRKPLWGLVAFVESYVHNVKEEPPKGVRVYQGNKPIIIGNDPSTNRIRNPNLSPRGLVTRGHRGYLALGDDKRLTINPSGLSTNSWSTGELKTIPSKRETYAFFQYINKKIKKFIVNSHSKESITEKQLEGLKANKHRVVIAKKIKNFYNTCSLNSVSVLFKHHKMFKKKNKSWLKKPSPVGASMHSVHKGVSLLSPIPLQGIAKPLTFSYRIPYGDSVRHSAIARTPVMLTPEGLEVHTTPVGGRRVSGLEREHALVNPLRPLVTPKGLATSWRGFTKPNINKIKQIIKTRLYLQKKRKAKKQRLETRRQKKRTRLFPRPTWIRFRMFSNFLNKRNIPEKALLTPIIQLPTEVVCTVHNKVMLYPQRGLEPNPFGVSIPVGSVTPMALSYPKGVRVTACKPLMLMKKLRTSPLKGTQQKSFINYWLKNKNVSLKDTKFKANIVNFKAQKQNNPPNQNENNSVSTILRDFWVWFYNTTANIKYNGDLSTLGGVRYWLLADHNNPTLWALNKTFNKYSFTPYNKRFNLWGLQKQRNQSKNNKTIKITKQLSFFKDRFFMDKNLNIFNKKIYSKMRTSLQKLNYLNSLKGIKEVKNILKQPRPSPGGAWRAAEGIYAKGQRGVRVSQAFKFSINKYNLIESSPWWTDLQIKQKASYAIETNNSSVHNIVMLYPYREPFSLREKANSFFTLKGLGDGYKHLNYKQHPFIICSAFIFHFCAIISLISISQMRCFIKFHLILVYKLSNIYSSIITKINRLISYKLFTVHNIVMHEPISLKQNRKDFYLFNTVNPKGVYVPSAWSRSNPHPAQIAESNDKIYGNMPLQSTGINHIKDKTIVSLKSSPRGDSKLSFLFKKQFIRFYQPPFKFKNQVALQALQPELVMHGVHTSPYGAGRAKGLVFSPTHSVGKKPKASNPHRGLRRIVESYVPERLLSPDTSLPHRGIAKPTPALFLKTTVNPYGGYGFTKPNAKLKAIKNLTFFTSKNNVSYYIKNIKLLVKKESNKIHFFTKNAVFKTLFNIIDLFQYTLKSIYAFFEKPAEFATTWIAYGFLVEWSSDVLALIPENMDIYVWNTFSKISRPLSICSLNSKLYTNLTLSGINAIIRPEGYNTSLYALTSSHPHSGVSLRAWKGLGLNIGKLTSTFSLLSISFLLQRRIAYFFDFLVKTVSQPDSDLMRRQQKGTLFWDIWADFLVTAADQYNVNIAALSTIKAEQNSLIDNISNSVNTYPLPSPRHPPSPVGASMHSVHRGYGTSSFKFLPSSLRGKQINNKTGRNNTLLSQMWSQLMPLWNQQGFAFSRREKGAGLLTNPLRPPSPYGASMHCALQSNALPPKGVRTSPPSALSRHFVAGVKHNKFGLKGYGSKKDQYNFNQFKQNKDILSLFNGLISWNDLAVQNRWSVNQFITYQSWHNNSDLFIDYHPPKTFTHLPNIKYNNMLQQPIGILVCQIYSGIFNKQISKNILLVNNKNLKGITTSFSNSISSYGSTSLLSSRENESKPQRGLRAFNSGGNKATGPENAYNQGEATIKTDYNALLIQALAGETELKIITDNAKRYALVNRGFAIGIKLLRDVFDKIKFNTPCIFLLEDIDAIGERRPMLISDYSGDDNTNNSDLFMNQRDEIHEKNQVIYQNFFHAVTHYKKPFKGDYSLAIPTNKYLTDLYKYIRVQSTNNYSLTVNTNSTIKPVIEEKSSASKISDKKSFATHLQITQQQSQLTPPNTSPFSVLLLKDSSKITDVQFQNKVVGEFPWVGFPGEQLSTKPRVSYSIRAKVAMLAELSLSNLSAKLDMITDLLVIIDSVRGNRGFVVFATTNVPHVLDPALRRPGRLDETICMPTITNSAGLNPNLNSEILKIMGYKNLTINLNDFTLTEKLNNALISKSNLLLNKFNKGIYTPSPDTPIPLALSSPCSNNFNVKELNKLKSIVYYEVGKYILNFKMQHTNKISPNGIGGRREKGKTFLSNSVGLATGLTNINYLAMYGDYVHLIQELLILFGGKMGQFLSSASTLRLPRPENLKMGGFVALNFLKSYKVSPSQSCKPQRGLRASSRSSQTLTALSYPFYPNPRYAYPGGVRSAYYPRRGLEGKGVRVSKKGKQQNADLNSNDLESATSLMKTFIQKRYLSHKNLIVPKLLSFVEGTVLDEPPSPPFSSLLIPAKRFENYKRVFRDSIFSDNMGVYTNLKAFDYYEKIQYHLQLSSIKKLKSGNLHKNLAAQDATPLSGSVNPIGFTGGNVSSAKIQISKLYNLKSLQTPTNTNWYYQNRILKRHSNYLTNQWWNGQLSEHNAESVFLSDIDWRSSFIKTPKTKKQNTNKNNSPLNISDVLLDFPDADQYYNPRRRRWLLQKGYWSFWFNYDQIYNEQILYHLVFESLNKTYAYLYNNSELLDYLTSKFISLGYQVPISTKGFQAVTPIGVSRSRLFSPTPSPYGASMHSVHNSIYSIPNSIKEIQVTYSFKKF